MTVLVCLMAGGSAAVARAGEVRAWTDITGRFSREAEFVRLEEGKVYLRLSGGKETAIPLKELSKKDRDWVRGLPPSVVAAGVRIVIRSHDVLAADLVFLADALPQPALRMALPAFLARLSGGQILDGFDVTRPVVITLPEISAWESAVVAIPVLGRERFTRTLDSIAPKSKPTASGRQYALPAFRTPLHAKPGEGYFLLSLSAAAIKGMPADPPTPAAVADLSVELNFDDAPQAARDHVVATLAPWIASSATLVEAVTRVARDARRATLEFNVDPSIQIVSMAVSVWAGDGTPLARDMETAAATSQQTAREWILALVPSGGDPGRAVEAALEPDGGLQADVGSLPGSVAGIELRIQAKEAALRRLGTAFPAAIGLPGEVTR